ncbi:MAG: OmpA family protein [Deltaproteobacteria bacterium]|nr:OmpA family protein [Deltaproteobacteria bacterium]
MSRASLCALFSVVGSLVVASLCAGAARAQTLDDAAGQGPGSLDVERARPALDRASILDVDSADVGVVGDTDAAVRLGWARAPLTGVLDAGSVRASFGVVDNRVGLHLGGAMTLWPRLKLGVDVPLVLFQSGPASLPGLAGDNPVAAVGVGDLRVVGRYGVTQVRAGDVVDLAVVGHLTLPTALPRHQYIGDGLPTLAVELAASRDDGPLRFAANVGPKLRVPSAFGPAAQGVELGYRAGVGYEPTDGPLGVDSALTGGALLWPAPLSAGNNPAELSWGVHGTRGDLLPFGVVGVGVPGSGVGAPSWRLQAGVRWSPRCDDDDDDGLCRAEDACPKEPEDKDGHDDGDGCPDRDNDGDGVFDDQDACPGVAGPEAGCPRKDGDGDGVFDSDDRCVEVAEDKDGHDDDDGCPDPDDKDGDGVLDPDDGCPAEPEDKDGDRDGDGCPDPDDTDGDGLLDAVDRCPTEPEDKDGDRDDDGCVDAPIATLVLDGGVSFGTASARLKDAARDAVDALAAKVKASNRPYRVRIDGYTDNVGQPDKNRVLSQKRANAVQRRLVQQGLDAARIEAVGRGDERPVADNDTDEGRAKNRRTEVVVDDS